MGTIPVLFSFARSGGTLVNQLLGVHPQCLVLSEVNPAGSYKAVADQAVEWLDLATDEERAALDALPYSQRIAALHRRAQDRNRTLVVRDWSTVNFMAGCSPDPVAPSGLLEQTIYLDRAGLVVRPLAITRRARDVVDSARRHFRGWPSDAEMGSAYLRYARAIAGYPRVKLEELRAEPEAGVARILETFGLDPVEPAQLLAQFSRFDKCTGNNTLAEPAVSSRAAAILPPEPKTLRDGDPVMVEADSLLGYD